jgi:FkbM family methyltransferase
MPLSRKLLEPGVRLTAFAVRHSSLLSEWVRTHDFRGKRWLVALMHPNRTLDAECGGVRYQLDLRDDVQREIYFNTYEAEELQRVLALIPTSNAVCLDIGANIGFYTLNIARHVGPSGRVYSFEPDPRNAQRLQRNIQLNGFESIVQLHRAAMSNREGTVTFYRSGDDSSGLGSLEPVAEANAGKIEVPATTLDTFLQGAGIDRVDFLKLDVEAHELEVLEGGSQALRAGVFRHILLEFNGPLLTRRGKGIDDFLKLFTAAGYQPLGGGPALWDRLRDLNQPANRRVENLFFGDHRPVGEFAAAGGR